MIKTVFKFWFLDKNKVLVASFELQVKYKKKVKMQDTSCKVKESYQFSVKNKPGRILCNDGMLQYWNNDFLETRISMSYFIYLPFLHPSSFPVFHKMH